jgi:hypothetical protein
MNDQPELETPEEDSAEFGVEEQDDGSALVSLPEDDEAYESADFSENLADYLPEGFLASLGAEQAELIDSDRESRAARDKQYAEGIRRTGLGADAPGGAGFDGSSKAVHPMLAKGCVDFASRAIKELFPATGPCKTQIIGEANDVKVDKAERKKNYMNWQLTTRVQEQRAEFERLLSQLPLGGSQYKRWWWDAHLDRPRTETVYIDDVFMPYDATDFYTCRRVTHRQYVAKDEYENRIDSGLYRDVNSSTTPPGFSDQSESRKANERIEGNDEDDTAYNDEGLREIYMSYVDLPIEGDSHTEGKTAPYILHIENDTQKVLGLYRNWKEDDEQQAKKHWMVEYNFIPWRGVQGVGLFHLIGSLSAGGTGALRALLDSAHISNFPGGLKLKGGRTAGQSIQVNATELAEIDCPPGVDDIRKVVMPFPFAGPSPVLFNLLEWLTNQAEGVISTASEAISGSSNDMPVGTALALIEHGSVNFSAIHARCHASLKKELEILHRLDAENMTDEETIEELGELVVSRQDFQGPMDIIPVSDPNIFSEAQRYAQLQAVMQLAGNPDLKQYFKTDRLLQRALRLLQINSPDDLANLPKDARRMSALDENYMVCSEDAAPLKVYDEQDDVSHLEAHLHFLVSPIFGANPLVGTVAFGPLMPHLKDHLMSFYKKHTHGAADAMQMIAPSMGAQMTRAQAESKGAAFADQMMAQILAPMIMPAMTQAQQLAKQFAPKPPVNPDVQAQIAGQQAIEAAKGQAKSATDAQEMQAKAQSEQAQLAFKANESQRDRDYKVQMAQQQQQFEQWKIGTQQDADDRATTMATAIESHALQMQQRMDMFQAQQEKQRADDAARAELERDQRRADNDSQLAVLQAALQSQVAAAVPQPIDIASVIQPIIDQMQGNTERMLSQLGEGLAGIHIAHSAPRVARYIKDAAGNNIGVESVLKQEISK